MALFQHAHVEFAQTRIENDVAATGVGNNACRLLGTTEIAGNDVRDAQCSGTFRHLLRLLLTFGGERTV
ncbi:hypothetical protein D3C87_1899150 [compost metagenome]